ncbi:MAG TPA: MFS transporter [Candidatus Binataceae bacterium]
MTQHDRQGWLVIAGVVAVNFVVMGPSIGTIGIFFTPLIKEFGWSRQQVSWMATAFLLAMGIVNPLVGWLLDRMPVRIQMSIGIAMAGLSFLLASRAHSLAALVVCYAIMGLGVGSSTILPGMVVAANWFVEKRALAIGITIAGAGLGGCLQPPLVAHLILAHGWRATMVCIGVPMFVVALPIALLLIRTRPAGESAEEQAGALTGLDLGPALLSIAFWMLVGMHLAFTVAFAGSYFHMVPYLIGTGYSAQSAAYVFGAAVAVSLPGYLLLGSLADRFGAKPVLAGSLIVQAASMILLLGLAGHHFTTVLMLTFIVCYGLTVGSGTALGSALLAESLGLKSFGSLAGIIGLIATMGSSIGPIVAGHIYDTTASYTGAYELCGALMLAAAVFATLVYPAEGRDRDVASTVALRAGH